MNLDQLLVHIRCKQYSLATKEIGSSVLHTREALLVIYEIANTVMHRQVLSQEEKRDFVSLVVAYKRRTAHMIKDYREKDTVKYYNCLHFMVKYIATEYLVELLELRELILLDREQVVHNEAAQVFYAGTYNLILKEVIKESHLTHHQIIELMLLQLEMRLVVMEDFAKNIASLFYYFCQININTELQHNCLITILTIIYPSERHADNLCYFSSVLNVLQQICVKGLKSEDDYKIDLSIIILLMKKQYYIAKAKSSTAIIDILITLSLEDVDFLPQLFKALKIETFHKFGIQEMFFITKVYCFIIVMMQTWKSSANTVHHISENSTNFMKIIKLMNKHFLANMKVCQCCSMKLDPSNNLQLCTVAVNLLKHCHIFTPLIELYEPMFYISNELLLQMKTANCQDFNKHWSKCISLLNNIGIEMITNNQNGGEKFLQLLLKLIGKFGLNNNFSKSNLHFILKLISFYINQKDYKLTVLFTAIAVYLDVVNFDKVFQCYQYAVYKLNLSLSEQERICGIPHILNRNIETAKEYIPTLGEQVDNSRTEEILLLELNAYLTKGQSMSSVVNLIKQLAKCSDSTRIRAIIQKHYTIFASLDHDMVTILQNLLQDCKSSNLCSAVLNYLIANNITHKLIQLNNIDINNATVPQKAVTSSQFEPAPDPNDTCDIVSTYSGLSLKNHKTILAYLKSSLDDIQECYDQMEDTSELEMSFELCCKLAHSFRLQCNFIYSECAWILAKTIATKLQDKLKLLEAIGWLLNKADLNESTKQLLAEGNAISKELCDGVQLSWYHLHICNFHLMNCQWDLVVEEYHATRNCMRMLDFTTEDKTGFSAHFAFLESMLSRMPCAVAIDKPHKPELLPKKALRMLVSFFNSGSYSKMEAFHLTTYFEEIDDVLMRLSLMRFPREIRLHGRDAVTLAQKLLLPMRTARILTHLAKADILSCNMNDCQMKLDGIANILDLPVLNYKPRNVRAKDDLEDNSYLDSQLVDQFHEIRLDVPKTSSMSGSPTFRKRFYNVPIFTNHLISCDCFQCTTHEYTILILGKLHIDFLLSELQMDPAMSEVAHEMALKVYNFLSTREEAFKKIITKDYKRVGNETYAHFLLDFPLKLGIIQYNIHKAIECNHKIFDLLKDDHRYVSNLLLCEAKVQRYLLLMHQKSLDILETHDILNDESEILMDAPNDDKTPERKVNSNTLLKTTENSLVHPERLKINIPFHLSDDEDDSQSMKPPNAITNKNKSPVPTFKVFDDTTKAKSSQKSTRSSSNKSAKVDLNTAFYYPPSASSKVKERTAKKTKVLTEKLKRSAKKQYDSNNSTGDEDVEPQINKNIRKNLMQELQDCENEIHNVKCEDPQSNRVRRTTRRKN